MHNEGDEIGKGGEDARSCPDGGCGTVLTCPMCHPMGIIMLGIAAAILLFGGEKYRLIGWLVFFLAYLAPNLKAWNQRGRKNNCKKN